MHDHRLRDFPQPLICKKRCGNMINRSSLLSIDRMARTNPKAKAAE